MFELPSRRTWSSPRIIRLNFGDCGWIRTNGVAAYETAAMGHSATQSFSSLSCGRSARISIRLVMSQSIAYVIVPRNDYLVHRFPGVKRFLSYPEEGPN